MKRLALVALAACGSSAKKPDETLTLTAPAPAVGLVIHEESTRRSTMTLSRDGESSDVREDEHEVSRSEVLKVDGGAITRVRISYSVKESAAGPSPLEGHTYEVWYEAGNIKAARVDVAEVSDAEADELAEDHGDLGQVPPLATLLTGRTWTRGEPVTLDDTTFTWIGAGVFSTDKTVEKDGVVTTLHGQLELDPANMRPVQITTSGEVHGDMSGATLAGTLSSQTIYRYDQ